MSRLAERLARAYGTPDLGNQLDPLDEAVYIVLTYQTDLSRAQQTYRALRTRYPTWEQVASADARELADILRPSGLQRSRARLLRLLLESVRTRFGAYDLSKLRGTARTEAEAELRRLPGMELKGARCVLLYALGVPALPVDSNTFRFMRRFGVLTPRSIFRRKVVHDGLEQLVPPSCRHSLHVNLVVHGQRTCLPHGPRCPVCPVRRSCSTGRTMS